MYTCITGSAGTGKSITQKYLVGNQIDKGYTKPEEIIILSADKSPNRPDLYNFIPVNNVKAILTFIFCILKKLKRLPKPFQSIENEVEFEASKEFKLQDYNELTKIFLCLPQEEIMYVLESIRLIVVDEYQQFPENCIWVIKRLLKIYDCDLILTLDQNKCFQWTNKFRLFKIRDNFYSLLNDLQIPEIEIINKDINIRNSPAIIDDWQESTLYINHFKSRFYGATTRIYLPERKDKNTINIPNLVKIEMSLRGALLSRKFFFGRILNVIAVLKFAREGLDRVYDQWFRHFHRDLVDTPEKFPEIDVSEKLGGFEEFRDIFYRY